MHDETMTDEEKEREAERLFVLFRRMEKNPAVSLGNPVREKLEKGELEADDVSACASMGWFFECVPRLTSMSETSSDGGNQAPA